MRIEVICWKFARESASAVGSAKRSVLVRCFRRISEDVIRKTRKESSKKEIEQVDSRSGVVDDRYSSDRTNDDSRWTNG